MKKIGKISDYKREGIFPLVLDGKDLLIVHHDQTYYVIENKCGHFGIPLADGELKGKEIICSGHGISFNLQTGNVVNRPYENCDPVKTYLAKIIDGVLFYE